MSLPNNFNNIKIIKEKLLNSIDKIKFGICAMDKKVYISNKYLFIQVNGVPLQNLLTRLDKDIFDIIIFGNNTILNKNIEDWPLCDVLMAFYSHGFPLDKANQYAKLRHPFLINEIDPQFISFLIDLKRI